VRVLHSCKTGQASESRRVRRKATSYVYLSTGWRQGKANGTWKSPFNLCGQGLGSGQQNSGPGWQRERKAGGWICCVCMVTLWSWPRAVRRYGSGNSSMFSKTCWLLLLGHEQQSRGANWLRSPGEAPAKRHRRQTQRLHVKKEHFRLGLETALQEADAPGGQPEGTDARSAVFALHHRRAWNSRCFPSASAQAVLKPRRDTAGGSDDRAAGGALGCSPSVSAVF
jgi:hypothetical protein